MKIVCDNCATKYQIADEKVSGKAFKIRCKKCGAVTDQVARFCVDCGTLSHGPVAAAPGIDEVRKGLTA